MKEIFLLFVLTVTQQSLVLNAKNEAQFQLHDKSVGNLAVHATKNSAKITAVADSVQLVIEPGMEEVPQKRATIDVSPSKHTDKIKSKSHQKKSSKQTKLQRKFKTVRKLNIKSKGHSLKLHDVTGSKKTLNDKEMRVRGQSGALHVHTDSKYTKLNSESGKLEVYIKNPDHHEQETAEHHGTPGVSVSINTEVYKKDQAQKAFGKIHVVQDANGLKKSIVVKNVEKCLVPPCTS